MNNIGSLEIVQNRFAFGKNWSSFLGCLNDARILEAEKSLQIKLDCVDLNGKVFLDIGSGSGLFSLAAYRLGAQVFSFDYDIAAVNCTRYLKQKYAQYDARWTVEQGSVLDKAYLQAVLKKIGPVDIVYAWGVLHHTGHMYQAFEHVSALVREGGKLFISIYNDQGGTSRRWKWIKQKYNQTNFIGKFILSWYAIFRSWTVTFIKDFLKTGNPLKTWRTYEINRGMSAWHDAVDWVGGYPFEVAKPEAVFDFFKAKGFQLMVLKSCGGGLGCNEFVFQKLCANTYL